MDSTKKKKEEGQEYLGILDPLLEKYQTWIDKRGDSTVLTYTMVLAGVIIGLSVLFYFVPVPEPVHVITGFPLGLAAFLAAHFFLYKQERTQKANGELTFKERYSPAQRLRQGGFATAGIILVSFVIRDFIPYMLGGVIVIAVFLTLYNYVRRTKEEVIMDQKGIADPRDALNEDEEDIADSDEPTLEEAEEYADLLNSLPEEQRKLLLNPKLNSAITVIDEDDIKKKRRLFGK